MKHTPSKAMMANGKKGLEMAKMPEISNNSLPDTSMKSGKKLAAGAPISDDHVRAMAQYHAAHAGECPAGGDAEHCDDMLWGGPAGAQWSASRVAAMDATTLSEDTGPTVGTLLAADDPFSIELYTRPELLLEGKLDLAKDENGLIWSPILRSGTLACRPDPTSPTGRKHEPLVFVPGHATDPKEIGLADLKDAFDESAIQHVTIPKTHRNDEFENTGYIKALKIADSTLRPGEKVLLAGHEFLDADAEARVEKGLIANRSCGILHGYVNTETGKQYPHVIEHVALTNKPWVTGMEAYGTDIFSDGRQVTAMMLSDETSVFIDPPSPEKLPKAIFSTADPLESFSREHFADVVWSDDDGPSLNQLENGLYTALEKMGQSPYFDEDSVYFSVRDIKPTSALITMNAPGVIGANDAFVVPFTWSDGKLTLGDFANWKVVTQEWVTDDDAQQDKDEVQQLLQQQSNLSLADAEAIVATYLDVSAADRKKAEKDGDTMPGGKYPIRNQQDANKAYILRNNGKADPAAVMAHIKKQVKKHGLVMPGSKGKTNASIPTDPLKRASALRLSREHTTTATGGSTMGLTPELLESLNLSKEAKEVLTRQMHEEQATATRLAQFEQQEKEAKRATRLSRAKEIFGETATGTLAVIDQLLMADDNDVAATLMLSDATGNPVKTNLTVSQILDRIFDSVTTGDSVAKTALAQKASLIQNPLDGRPDLKPDPSDLGGVKEMSGDDLLSEWSRELGGNLDLSIKPTPATTTA